MRHLMSRDFFHRAKEEVPGCDRKVKPVPGDISEVCVFTLCNRCSVVLICVHLLGFIRSKFHHAGDSCRESTPISHTFSVRDLVDRFNCPFRGFFFTKIGCVLAHSFEIDLLMCH